MRKKAENKIRKAAAELGKLESYRIDKVRNGAGLIRKVFDKTILDMDRVGTIELSSGRTDAMSPSEINNLIHVGEKLYVQFKFLDSEGNVEALKSEKVSTETIMPPANETEEVDIVLLEVDPAMWQRFKHQCLTREDKDPIEKLLEMVRDYIT